MPNTKCCVPGCLNSYPKAPKGTTWHPIPKNENLAKEWMAKIGENVEKEKINLVVCSDHFNEKDFKTSSLSTRNKSRILSSSAVSSIFKCKEEKKCEKAMPFWKVTSACKQLTEIRIISKFQSSGCWVHEDSLNAIAFCAKIEVLHLAGFFIKCKHENASFDLSIIPQSCHQLQKLYAGNVYDFVVSSNIFNKNMKAINIDSDVKCDQTFLNNLSQCEHLEKMVFETLTFTNSNYDKFANVLRKLKHLTAIVVKDIPLQSTPASNRAEPLKRRYYNEVLDRLQRILTSIQNERPALYFSLDSNNYWYLRDIPEAHLDCSDSFV